MTCWTLRLDVKNLVVKSSNVREPSVALHSAFWYSTQDPIYPVQKLMLQVFTSAIRPGIVIKCMNDIMVFQTFLAGVSCVSGVSHGYCDYD